MCASEANKLSMWEKLLDSKFSMWRISLVHQRSKNDVGSGTLRHEQRQKSFFFFFTENIRREERISHQKWCFHRELAEANLEHFKTCPFLI